MTSSATSACPLCDHACADRNHLRQHLHRHHRKIELIDTYLETTDRRRPIEA
ncbi:hypothetical protein [Halegenticoccus soli]|uniref:hypothetical protein n=1 Tax=Halegenticoccus soli TaxID=1985678 RepID=UPI001304070A|nr:hypothetical protein [Halegenticoccus soli]